MKKRTRMFLPILVILAMLASMLGMAIPVMAASAQGEVQPNTIMNDGAHTASFSWNISDWEGTTAYYTFAVHGFGNSTPIYIQYSDDAGTDNFPGISVPLQDIAGTIGVSAAEILQPEAPGPHVWNVPAGFAPGLYQAYASLYLVGQTFPVAQALITFTIVNVDIDLTKYVSVDNQSNWEDANSAPGPGIEVDEDVYFKFCIENTGSVDLTGITLTDDMYSLAGITPALPASLTPQQVYCGVIGPVTATAGNHTNTGNATGSWESNLVWDTDPANYHGVDVRISITPLEDSNPVGSNHTLTILLEKSVEDGVWTPFEGETVTASLSNDGGATAAFVGSNSGATDASGEFDVMINSPTAGNTTVEADWAGGTVEGAVITAKTTDPDAVKDWEEEGDQGCTPGYWKNNAKNWDHSAWVGYLPTDSFETIFSVDVTLRANGKNTYPAPTLLEALDANGGGINALARHAVAALLNIANPDIAYGIGSEAALITMVHDAIVSGDEAQIDALHTLLAGYNEAGCPLNQRGEPAIPD